MHLKLHLPNLPAPSSLFKHSLLTRSTSNWFSVLSLSSKTNLLLSKHNQLYQRELRNHKKCRLRNSRVLNAQFLISLRSQELVIRALEEEEDTMPNLDRERQLDNPADSSTIPPLSQSGERAPRLQVRLLLIEPYLAQADLGNLPQCL